MRRPPVLRADRAFRAAAARAACAAGNSRLRNPHRRRVLPPAPPARPASPALLVRRRSRWRPPDEFAIEGAYPSRLVAAASHGTVVLTPPGLGHRVAHREARSSKTTIPRGGETRHRTAPAGRGPGHLSTPFPDQIRVHAFMAVECFLRPGGISIVAGCSNHMAGHRRELRATRIKKELTHHEGARRQRVLPPMKTVPAKQAHDRAGRRRRAGTGW